MTPDQPTLLPLLSPLTLVLQAIGGIAFGVTLVWAMRRIDGRGATPALYGTLIFLLLMLADVIYAVFRLTGFLWTGTTDSAPVVITGFFHWLVFSICAGVVAGWSRR